MRGAANTLYRVHLGPGWRPVGRDRLAAVVRGVPVLVTGASSGIGARTAQLLGSSGAHVYLSARRVDRLERVAEDVVRRGGTATVVPTDGAPPARPRHTAAVARLQARAAHPGRALPRSGRAPGQHRCRPGFRCPEVGDQMMDTVGDVLFNW